MKKKTIALLLVLMLVFGVSAGGTIAWLTSTASVTNTFTVGNVKITLDEALVDVYGVADNSRERIPNENNAKNGNAYKLIPGHTYTKDPIVHVQPGSEKCYVFVKLENGIEAIETEATGATMDEQIRVNNWKPLANNDGVYYRIQDAIAETGTVANLPVFTQFTLADDADVTYDATVSGDINYENAKVIVTAYAIQLDGMTSVADAWAKLNPTP